MQTPLITEIQRFSLQDGPGIRTTIFVKGCPLHCPWCHNPETQNREKEFYFYADKCVSCGRCVEVCPTGASVMITGPQNEPVLKLDRSKCNRCLKCVDACIPGARVTVGKDLPMDAIIKEAAADLPFFKNSGGGVTLSGGDPLLFPEFTLEITKRLKAEKIHVGLETSCFQKWEKIEPLLPYVDLFLVDIKSLNPQKHKDVLGWQLKPILQNIETLIKSNANIRIHLPIIPGFNNSTEDFEAYVSYLGKFAKNLTGIDVLPYHVYGEAKYSALNSYDTYKFKDIGQIPGKDLWPLINSLKKTGVPNLTVGGLVGIGGDGHKKSFKKEVVL
ncbi:glycyl-radical enzyme activating protein [Desulfosarcina widdelii]|nr:glycyl-radical enzyme activating protein [Desulfosarcina widdelii]